MLERSGSFGHQIISLNTLHTEVSRICQGGSPPAGVSKPLRLVTLGIGDVGMPFRYTGSLLSGV